MARIATILIISLLQVFVATLAVRAQDQATMDDPFEITADEIKYDGSRNLYVADRNVRVLQGGRSLRARWVAFSTETRLGVAEGDVQLVEGGDRLHAQFMVFNVDTLQGTLYQGELDAGSDGFRVDAKELIRTGENTFAMRDGLFTTCRCEEGERVPWALRSKKANVELGDYGTLTNSTFEVLGVPVLWIPWVFFPVKSERETGLLLPDFQFGGRGGVGAGLPFFWAVHPQLNVTLTPRYYSQRGYKQDVEFEYVFGETSKGELFVAGLSDKQGGEFLAAPRARWAVLWHHDQELPADWRWHTDLNLSSDNLYSDDFQELRKYNSFRYIESTSNIARDFGSSGGVAALAGARYADDVQGSRFTERDDYLLQRFAEVRADVLPGTLRGPLGIDARLDSEFIYFSGFDRPDSRFPAFTPLRTNGRFFDFGFDGRPGPGANGEGDGIFQPGEPLAERGGRLIVHPRLSRSFQIGNLFEVVPEIGWQESLYLSGGDRFSERGLLTARTDVRTRLVRDYTHAGGGVTRHLLEPRLGWAMVNQRQQKKNPLFVPQASVEQTRLRTLSLDNVTRNPSDRIDTVNQVVLSLGQRFFSANGPKSAPRLKADLITAIDWDFADAGLGNIVAEGNIFPIGPVSVRARTVFDPEAAAFEEGGVALTLSTSNRDGFIRRSSFVGGYRYLRRPPRFFETEISDATRFVEEGDDELNQVDFKFQVELAWRLRFTYAAIYGLTKDTKGFLRNGGMVEYVSKCRCWGVGVSIDHEKRDGFSGGFMIRFLGLGDEGSNLFDGGLGTGVNL